MSFGDHLGSSRRNFLKGSAGVALATNMVIRGGVANAATAAPVADTTYGKVRGAVVDGVTQFLGIRYGADTGGANRFLPPKPPAAWSGVRDALAKGSPCPQVRTFWGPFFADPVSASEDCLVLNVWSPAGLNDRLPVMVYFHGGAFESESGGVPGYDGYELAKQGKVVVVTLNHRLNVFGYGYVAEGADDRFATSGNVGQLDLLAAMHWVRDNIANFGGDTSNITIFGESGGGGKVSMFLAMPAARGLFHKAIVQSGSLMGARPAVDATATMARIYDILGVKRGDVAALQRVPTTAMVAALEELNKDRGAGLRFGPVADGHVFGKEPWASAPPLAAEVPMMIGTTLHETALFADVTTPLVDEEALIAAINDNSMFMRVPADEARKLIDLYRREMPDLSRVQLMVRITTDLGFWGLSVRQLDRKVAAAQAPVYAYQFDFEIPYNGGSWAVHGGDLPMMFGHPDYPQAWGESDSQQLRATGERYRLSKAAVKAWAAFAYTGNPSTPEHSWPAYGSDRRETMIFDREIRVVSDPRSAVRPAVIAFIEGHI